MSTPFNVVIPARYASSRLPGKPLLDIAGKSMLQHVYERALDSGASQVVIATDDERILLKCQEFSAPAYMTSIDHQSGTDRLAEVIDLLGWPDDMIIVNLQGDEPLMRPELVRQVAEDLAAFPQASIATLCSTIQSATELFDPNVVKVIMDKLGYSLYFSRAPIPWDRDTFAIDKTNLPPQTEYFRHIGLYAYTASFIKQYRQMTPCYLERSESLEQLRALWHGHRIHLSHTETPPGHGVDTPEDLVKVQSLLSVE